MFSEKIPLLNLVLSMGTFVMIWFVQILHYPSFIYFHETSFPESMKFHQGRISWLVIPLMLLEVAFALLLVVQMMTIYSLVQIFLLVIIWSSTFFLQVPHHNRLLIGKDDEAIKSLGRSNWIRTIAWTLKLLVAFRIATSLVS